MKKKTFIKVALSTVAVCSCCAVVACSSGTDSLFYHEPKKEGPQFLEGCLTEMKLTDTMVLDEFIDYDTGSPYTITLTDEGGNVLSDLTSRATWNPDEPGVYYLVYKIDSGKNKGENKHKITVKTPELKCSYSLQNKPYNMGDVLVFEEYFDKMNIYADSYYDWGVYMDSVTIGEEVIDLSKEESYQIASTKDHTFKFHIGSEDGQRVDVSEVVSVKNIDYEYFDRLKDELNITSYNELNVIDGEFTMLKGQYKNGAMTWLDRTATPHDLPYIAYNSNYGIGSFVQVDFTGNNMPLVSFFRDENYSPSIFDSTKGILFSGGVSNNAGGFFTEYMCSCFALYGPNMVYALDRDSQKIQLEDGTKTVGAETDISTRLRTTGEGGANAYPGTMATLEDGKHYRLVCGVSHLSADEKLVYFKAMVVDLDNREILCNFTLESWNMDALIRDCLDTEKFAKYGYHLSPENYYHGNIVLYGNYGQTTTIDQLYPIITDKTFDEIVNDYEYSSFNENAPTMIQVGATLNVQDFVNTSNANYKFYYYGVGGERVDITGSTFSIDRAGSYKLYYNDGEHYLTSLYVMVDDFGTEIMKWINDNNVSGYNVDSIAADGSVTLGRGEIKNGGSYIGPNANNLINQSYLAINGNYKLNDYLVLEFTGKNMPELAFFAKDYNESMYSQFGGKTGVVVASGVTLWNGSLQDGAFDQNRQIAISGPYMANFNSVSGGNSGSIAEATTSKLARAFLQDGVKYRVIVGFEKNAIPMTNGTESIVLKICLFDVTNGSMVEEKSIPSWYVFNNNDPNFFSQSVDSLSGSIVLYGKFATTCVVDKIYPVFTNTDMDAVKIEVNGNDIKYDVTFIDENQEKHVVKVKAGDIPVYNGTIPQSYSDDEFVYSYGWDKTLVAVTGNATYTLILNKTLKNGYKLHSTDYDSGRYTLKKDEYINGANYVGPNNNDVVNQSYVAIDGKYGFNDYLVFEFTGKNMPEIAFFANNYNDNMYYADGSKQGVVVATGVTLYNGADNNVNPFLTQKLSIAGPNMAYFNSCDGTCRSGKISDSFTSALARESLVDGKKYRVIIGFTMPTEKAITLNYCLMDISGETPVVVEERSFTTYNVFDNSDPKFFSMKASEIAEGSIVLYGKFGTDVVIDKIYGVYENTTIEAIKNQF